jgi:spoIIIJ-associated protein
MEKIEIIKKEVEDLLKKMIDKFEVEVEYLNDVYHVKIKADEEASIVIGKHGETIRSLQKILEVIFYKKFKEPINVLVNVNDFREKQKEKLENLYILIIYLLTKEN